MKKQFTALLLVFSFILLSSSNIFTYGQTTTETKTSTEAPASSEVTVPTDTPKSTESPSSTEITPTPTPTSSVINGLHEVNGNIYFYENGKLFTNGLKQVLTSNNKKGYYYFQKDGTALKNKLKKVEIKNKSYYFYFDKNGKALMKKWKKIKDNEYYFDKKGRAYTGYHFISNYYCKFDEDGTLIKKIDCDKKVIALTYDDGPSIYTQDLLDTIEKYDATATFFVVGNRVSTYADEVQNAFDLGCEIGNHTYTHQILTKVGSNEIKSQIKKTNKAVKKVTGESPKVMRPPGGAQNASVLSNIGMPAIIWSIDPMDWKTRNTEKTVSAVLKNPKDGDIVLMHDLYQPTVKAADQIIPALQKKGFQLVTVSELAACRKYKLEKGKRYSAFRKKK